MELPITTPALLFPAIAILMLGYVNRYIGAAGVIRAYKKDEDNGYKRKDLVEQLSVLKTRIEALRLMMMLAATALMLSCLSMLFIFIEKQTLGEIIFALSLILLVTSLFLSIFETSKSNTSLSMEISSMLKKHKSE